MRPSDNWKPRFGKLLIILGVAVALSVLITDLVSGQASVGAAPNHEAHGTEPPVAHSPVSIGLALMGPGILLAGLILDNLRSLRSLHTLSLVAGLTLLYADGLLHLLAVVEHLGEPLSASFFIFAGGVQVVAVPLARGRERLLWWVGVALTLFFIELYVLTRIIPPPFSFEPESLESLGTLSKATEVGILAALGVFFGPRMVPMRLRSALVHRRSFALLFVGASASLTTFNLEVQWYWRFLPVTVFVLASFLIIGLVTYAALAYYLKTGLLAGLTWVFAVMLLTLHSLYVVNYALAALAFPVVLCIVSGILLAAPIVSTWVKGW